MLIRWRSTLFSSFLDFEKACTQTPDTGAGRKKKVKGLLSPGSGLLAGTEILPWVGEDGNVQSFRLKEVSMVQLPQKIVQQFLSKLNIHPPRSPAILLLDIYPR